MTDHLRKSAKASREKGKRFGVVAIILLLSGIFIAFYDWNIIVLLTIFLAMICQLLSFVNKSKAIETERLSQIGLLDRVARRSGRTARTNYIVENHRGEHYVFRPVDLNDE